MGIVYCIPFPLHSQGIRFNHGQATKRILLSPKTVNFLLEMFFALLSVGKKSFCESSSLGVVQYLHSLKDIVLNHQHLLIGQAQVVFTPEAHGERATADWLVLEGPVGSRLLDVGLEKQESQVFTPQTYTLLGMPEPNNPCVLTGS